MSDNGRRPTASEIRRGVNELRKVILCLPDNPHKDNADRALDAVRDHAFRSLEAPPEAR
jgi:hypothetical protein